MRKKIMGWILRCFNTAFFRITDFYVFAKQLQYFLMEASDVFLQSLLACEEGIRHVFIPL